MVSSVSAGKVMSCDKLVEAMLNELDDLLIVALYLMQSERKQKKKKKRIYLGGIYVCENKKRLIKVGTYRDIYTKLPKPV